MRLQLFLAGVLLVAAPAVCSAQNSQKTKVKTKDDGTVKVKTDESKTKYKGTPPSWAQAHGYDNNSHVYFPDYYVFYDPARGYTYWDGTAWVTSATVPAFISTVDLNTARIEMLHDARLNEHPELKYDTYIRQYPAQPVGITVQVPPMR